jgi:hypothetical protein
LNFTRQYREKYPSFVENVQSKGLNCFVLDNPDDLEVEEIKSEARGFFKDWSGGERSFSGLRHKGGKLIVMFSPSFKTREQLEEELEDVILQ